jgi:ligand-binding sensor domain-containing protein
MKRTSAHLTIVLALLAIISLACGSSSKEKSSSEKTEKQDQSSASASLGEDAEPQEQAAAAGESGWRIFSNANEVYGLDVYDGKLYAATLGGAVAWDLKSGEAVKFTTLDGLRHISAHDVVACSVPEPRLVFATEYGLSFLDPETGQWDNTQITPEDSRVGTSRVTRLFCDQENERLLIAYTGVGMLDLSSGGFTRFEESQGLAWQGASGFGVQGKDIWIASGYKYAEVVKGSKITSYEKESGFPADSAYSVAVAPDGVVWMGVNNGLAAYSKGSWKLIEGIDDLPASANDLAVTSDGKIWLGNHARVCLFNPASSSCEKTLPNPLQASILRVALDEQDNPYFATKSGILALDGAELKTLLYPGEQLAGNFVTSVAQDADGMLWVATENGAQRFDPQNPDQDWELFKYDSSKPDSACGTWFNGVFPQADGSVWLASSASRACGFDGKQWVSYGKDQGMVGSSISAVAVDAAGNVWVATNEGVNIWDGSKTRSLGEADGLPAKTVRSLLADGKAMWIGTTAGLVRYEGGDLEVVINKENAPKSEAANVKQIVKEADGSLLLATPAGVVRYADGEAELLFVPEPTSGLFGIPNTSVSALALGEGGQLWAATYSGVYYFDGSDWQQITPEHGLPATNVNTLVVDNKGAVWIGAGYTNSGGGLARYVPGSVPPGETAAKPSVNKKDETEEESSKPVKEETKKPAKPSSSKVTLSENGWPVMPNATDLYESDSTLNYMVKASLKQAREFYLEEFPKTGWLLDLDEKGKCRDNDRCMGWHGGYDAPQTTTFFFLKGEKGYLTLNFIEEGSKINVIVSLSEEE